MALPKYVALQSKYNHKYLQFVHQEGGLHGFLQFSGHDVVSPYTKFEVLVSEADQTLVHLRSCYNNKYWVPSTDLENWLLAAANEPEEDQTKLSCTLFRPTYVGGDPTAVRFMHANVNKHVALMNKPGTYRDTCTYLASASPGQALHDVCTVIDWSSLVIFPQNIAVKGSDQGKYLSARPLNELKYLRFVADDLADPTVGQEVFISGAGNISIKSQHYDRFWTRTTSSFVLADTQDNDVTDPNILFAPTPIPSKENVYALKSLGNNDYCKSIDIPVTPFADGVPVLSAADATITTLSQLEVVDRATSWSVTLDASDIRVSDARVTVPKPLVLGVGEVINDTDLDVETTVTLSYVSESSTRAWSSTANGSLKVGVTAAAVASPVPDEVNGQIVITGSITGNVVWGVEETESQPPTHVIRKVIVPARTKAIVRAMGEKRLWDVPFSYNQAITLYDNSVSDSKMDDGIYTGTQTRFLDIKVDFVPMN